MRKMGVKKKGFSNLVTYIFFVFIIISFSIFVFILARNASMDKIVVCSDEVDVGISGYECVSGVNGYLIINLTNKGYSNVDSFLVRLYNGLDVDSGIYVFNSFEEILVVGETLSKTYNFLVEGITDVKLVEVQSFLNKDDDVICQENVSLEVVCFTSNESVVFINCSDGIKNQDKTDVDCGGVTCSACVLNDSFLADNGCQSGDCGDNVYSVDSVSCGDEIKNQDETDVDCGGVTCDACSLDETCLVDSDCVSDVCVDSICSTVLVSCGDEIKNQDETDVDCGGIICDACSLSESCLIDNDCTDGSCFIGACIANFQNVVWGWQRGDGSIISVDPLYTEIQNVTITTSGGPLTIRATGGGWMPTDGNQIYVKLYRDNDLVAIAQDVLSQLNGDGDIEIQVTDTPSAGTYTYHLKGAKRFDMDNGMIDESLIVVEESGVTSALAKNVVWGWQRGDGNIISVDPLYTEIQNVTITTSGGPLTIRATGGGWMPTDGNQVYIKLYRDGKSISVAEDVLSYSNGDWDIEIQATDSPPAGTYTYHLIGAKRFDMDNGMLDESLIVIQEN